MPNSISSPDASRRFSAARDSGSRGFALLVALFLMAMMVLLSLSLSSLVRTASMASQDELRRMQTRQNTWTGLKVGVGHLQKLSGQDRRATATSDLTFPDSIEVGSSADVAFREAPDAFWATRNGFWTGVWRDERELGHLLNRSNPLPRFEGWLVSHRRADAADPSAEFQEGEMVMLHAGGLNRANRGTSDPSREEGRVYVPMVPFRFGDNEDGSAEGRFAFWVSDEGVKGRINLPRPTQFSVPAPLTERERWRLRSPQRFGWETLDLFAGGSSGVVEANLGRLRRVDDLKYWWDRIVPPGDAASRPEEYLAYDLHNFTTRSLSLFTDSRRGGFRMDLSHFRAQPADSESLALSLDDFDRGIEDAEPNRTQLDDLDVIRRGGSYARSLFLNTNRRFQEEFSQGHVRMDLARAFLNPEWNEGGLVVESMYRRVQAFTPNLVGYGIYFDFTRQGNELMLNVFPVYILWNSYDKPLAPADYTFVSQMSWDIFFEVRALVQMPNGSWYVQHVIEFNPPSSSGYPGGAEAWYNHVQNDYRPNPLRLSRLPGSTIDERRVGMPQYPYPHISFFNARELRFEPGEVVVLTPRDYAAPLVGGQVNHGDINLLEPGWNNENSFIIPTGVTLPPLLQNLEIRFHLTREESLGAGAHGIPPRFYLGTIEPSAYTGETQLGFLRDFSARNIGNPARFSGPWYTLTRTELGVQRGRRVMTDLDGDEVDIVGFYRGPSDQHTRSSGDQESMAIRYIANYNPRSVRYEQLKSMYGHRSGRVSGDYQVNRNRATHPILNRSSLQSVMSAAGLLDNFAGPQHPGNYFGPFFEAFPADRELLSVGQLKHAQWDRDVAAPGAYLLGNSLAPVEMSASAAEVMSDPLFNPPSYHPESAFPEFFDPERDAWGVRMAANGDTAIADTAFLINDSMWDRFYFSTVPQSGSMTPAPSFVLPNSRYRILDGLDGEAPSEEALRSLKEVSRHLGIVGGFNVNSTRVEAWKSLLGAFRDETVRLYNGVEAIHPSYRHPYPRVTNPVMGQMTPADPSVGNTRDELAMKGFRALSDSEIDRLAREIVREIRIRAWPDPNQAAIEARPFEHYHYRPALFLGDFINRRHVNTRFSVGALGGPASWDSLAVNHRVGVMGPLQAAIQAAGINDGFLDEELRVFGIGRVYRDTAEHHAGAKATNVPGYLSQSDLLQSLAPVLTTRSDTFTVRAFGESRGSPGMRLEAQLQRLPREFEGGDEEESVALSDRFGRPYRIVGYRWINE